MANRALCLVALVGLWCGVSPTPGAAALPGQGGEPDAAPPRLTSRLLTIYPSGVLIPMSGVDVAPSLLVQETEARSREVELASAMSPFRQWVLERDTYFGPVADGAPSHQEMLDATTPKAFNTPSAISFSIPGWSSKGR